MNHIKLFYLIVSTILLSSCDLNIHTVEKPEDLGHHMFVILEDLDDMNMDTFKSHFITTEEYHSLADMKSVDKKTAKKLLEIDDAVRDENIENNYEKLMSKSSKEKINWYKIKYDDFEFKLEEKNGLTICFGQVFFKFKKKHYKVKIIAYKTKDGYVLGEISSLKKIKN